ncbi:MAG TPA: RRQRL motif-containing zinc-binding protein [Pseudonocardiaceae bacterium]|nr:RRQRL motif-containing zinc-binding protein [Pseudonocardiaceae bacterium]
MARQFPWVLADVAWSDSQQFVRGHQNGLPLVSWGIAPREKLATYRQLRAAGLRPGGHGPVALLYFRHHSSKTFTLANLYLIADAQPVRPMTPAKWASIQAALAARRVCPECGEDGGDYIRPSAGMCEACQYSNGEWDLSDVRHDYVIGEPTLSAGALAAVHDVPTLSEITALDQARPAADASVMELAAWYDRKATVLDRLAAYTRSSWGHPEQAAEHEDYRTWAAAARQHATALLAEVA